MNHWSGLRLSAQLNGWELSGEPPNYLDDPPRAGLPNQL